MTQPKIGVAQVPAGEHAALYIMSLSNPDAVASYLTFVLSTLDLPPDDEEMVELVRIRNALAQDCRYCLSVRHAVMRPGEDLEDLVTHFEARDLPERQKVALRLAGAFLEHPSRLTKEMREEALEHFTPTELVGLLLKLASFLGNKPRSALGIDGPLDPGQLTHIDYSLAREMRSTRKGTIAD